MGLLVRRRRPVRNAAMLAGAGAMAYHAGKKHAQGQAPEETYEEEPQQAAPPNGGGQVSEIARTFGVDWTHLGAQIISFGVVCLVLYKFAYGRVLAMLEERRQQISQGLANAEKIKSLCAAGRNRSCVWVPLVSPRPQIPP